MKLNSFILFFTSLLLCSPYNLSAAVFSLSGSSTLSAKQTNIDKYNLSYPKGTTLSLNTLLLGEIFQSNFTGIIESNKDQENKIKIENIFFEFPFKKTKLNIGDFYLKYTPLSLDNLKIRGVNFNYHSTKNKTSFSLSWGCSKEKEEALNEDINQNGFLDYGEDKNNNHQLDIRDGIFAQFITATKFNLAISKNTNLSLNYFNIQDKYDSIVNPKSIYPYSAITPLKNDHFSLEGHIFLYKKEVYRSHCLLFEYNLSQFDQDAKDNKKYIDDYAYKITLNNKIGKTNFDLTYFLVNPDYKTAGNLYLPNNQEGFKLHALHQAKFFSIEIKGESFKDNINTIPIKNMVIKPNLILALPCWPKFNLGYKLGHKKRTFSESLSLQKIEKKEKTYSLGISQSIKDLNYFANLQLSNYLNNSSYKSNHKSPDYQNFFLNINLSTYPQKNKKLSTNFYFSYNTFKNMDNRDLNQSYQVNITSSYKLLPEKLIFSPLCEITRCYEKKNLVNNLRLKKEIFGGEWKYYFSTNQSLSFLYKKIKQKDSENKQESFESDILALETTIIF